MSVNIEQHCVARKVFKNKLVGVYDIYGGAPKTGEYTSQSINEMREAFENIKQKKGA